MNIDTGLLYQEVDAFGAQPALKELMAECVAAASVASLEHMRSRFVPRDEEEAGVSEASLRRLLARGEDVSDIRTDTSISNCLVFHSTNLHGSVVDPQVVELRRRVDAIAEQLLSRALVLQGPVEVRNSGHFWYPPGGFMSWHTNLRKPGWRMYLTHARSPGVSWFRYRDPRTDTVVTSLDSEWDCRLFQIRPDAPLWHAVYSRTDRFSFGYMASPA